MGAACVIGRPGAICGGTDHPTNFQPLCAGLGKSDRQSLLLQRSVAAARRALYGRRKLPTRGKLPMREVVVTVLKNSAWPWLMVAAVLIVVGLVVVDGTAGTIILACGFIALFGAGIKLISRNDPTPPQERRVPVGRDLPRPNQRSDSGI